MLQLTYELRPKWQNNKNNKNNNKNNKNKTQNAVSTSDPLQGSDKDTEYNQQDKKARATKSCGYSSVILERKMVAKNRGTGIFNITFG